MMRKHFLKSCVVISLLLASPVFAEVAFDGTDDRFDCGSASDLDDMWPASIVTRWYVNSSGEGYIVKKGDSINSDWGWYIDSDGSIDFFQGGTATFFVCAGTASDVSFSSWHTLGITWDNTVDSSCSGLKMYVDGSEVTLSSTSGAGTKPTDASNTFFINHESDSSDSDADISYMAVFGRVLTAAEMLNIHNANTVLAPLQVAGDDVLRLWWVNNVSEGSSYEAATLVDLVGKGDCTGDDGANNTGLTAGPETGLTY